jgi:hypothetical protein
LAAVPETALNTKEIMNILAAISGQSLIWAVVWVVIAAVIYWLVRWGVAQIGVSEPFAKVINVILVLAVVIFLINALLTLVGHPLIAWP